MTSSLKSLDRHHLAGLYDTAESDSSKVTDKNSKITYLAKLVKLVGMQLNTIVSQAHKNSERS